MSTQDETTAACPQCRWPKVEEDRSVPGIVYTVCGRCGAPLALRAERRAA